MTSCLSSRKKPAQDVRWRNRHLRIGRLGPAAAPPADDRPAACAFGLDAAGQGGQPAARQQRRQVRRIFVRRRRRPYRGRLGAGSDDRAAEQQCCQRSSCRWPQSPISAIHGIFAGGWCRSECDCFKPTHGSQPTDKSVDGYADIEQLVGCCPGNEKWWYEW